MPWARVANTRKIRSLTLKQWLFVTSFGGLGLIIGFAIVCGFVESLRI